MLYLLAATIIWSFSFSIIENYLAGQVDPILCVCIRTATAFFLFYIINKNKKIKPSTKLILTGIGSVQLGLMYIFLYKSFAYLTTKEVLLFTILTPIYITIISAIKNKKNNLSALCCAVIAIFGAFCIRKTLINLEYSKATGFCLVQAANICFAFGQVAFKKLTVTTSNKLKAIQWLYFGGFATSLTLYLWQNSTISLPSSAPQWQALFYLGAISSGLGMYLWNKGATSVTTAQLAATNNLLIPCGILIDHIFWNKDITSYSSLILGAVLIIWSIQIGSKKMA